MKGKLSRWQRREEYEFADINRFFCSELAEVSAAAVIVLGLFMFFYFYYYYSSKLF